jgi:archaellum component FlaG (FlaF/FlaG flagellin family)
MQRPQNIFQIYWYHINTLFYQLIGETTMQATQEQLKTLQTKAQKTADQLNQEVVIITQGKQHTQVQAGMAYQLSTKDFDIKDANLIAKKVDNDLEVSLEGSVVVFDDYFECHYDTSVLKETLRSAFIY